MFGLPWLHQLLFGVKIDLTEEELFERAKLIITTTFDHPNDTNYCVLDNHTQEELRQMIIARIFDPSANNNELLLLACRLKYKPIALRLIVDQRVNPFDNDKVADEVFMLMKLNKWNDILPHLSDKSSMDLQKRKEVCEKYERLSQKYKFLAC